MKILKRSLIEQKTMRAALTLALMLLTSISAWAQGTIDNPYEISNYAQLKQFASIVNGGTTDAYAVLTADIACTDNTWIPIGDNTHQYTGTFDGRGYTITGLSNADVTSVPNYAGLFGSVGSGGEVKKVVLKNEAISGNDYVGGIAGWNSGLVNDCHVLAGCTITGKGTLSVSAGGVVGLNNGGATVSYCTSAASISASSASSNSDRNFGGIAGCNGGSLTNNLAVGANIGGTSQSNRGAIAGKNEVSGTSGTLSNNFYSGCKVGTASSGVGCNGTDVKDNDGAVPLSGGYIVTVSNNITADILKKISGDISPYYKYAESETVTLSYYNLPEGYTLVYTVEGAGTVQVYGNAFDMPANNVTVSATLIDHWGIGDGADGSEAHPYIISTTAGLDLLASHVNSGRSYDGKYFELGADIVYTHKAANEEGADTENNYTAIGTYVEREENTYDPREFWGHFDGKGHTISGIRIYKDGNTDADSNQGLFGRVGNSGTVRNVTVSDTRIIANYHVGGIVGFNVGTVENCHATATVTILPYLDNTVNHGGVVGYNNEGTVKGCTSAATVDNNYKSNCSEFGGVVGCNFTKSLIENSLAIGATVNCESNCGAITGRNLGTISHNYYAGCTANGKTASIGTSNGDKTENDGAVKAVILSETQTSMPAMTEGEKVVSRRSFTQDVASTVCLPFGIDADQAAAAGKFYEFVGVDKTGANWEVIMQETDPSNLVSGALTANTPYLFVPAATGPVLFYGTAPATIDAGTTSDTEGWTFKGSYTSLTYGTNLYGNVYGFAAGNYDGGSYTVSPGDFVKAMDGATIAPFRCYLTYSDGSSTRGTTGSEALPSTIAVRLVGANGNTTEMDNVHFSIFNSQSDFVYDLSGRRLNGQPTAKGIYIYKGKKVIR